MQAATSIGSKRGREEAGGRTRLSFDGHELGPVSLFLYFLYHPEHAAAANMGKLGERLPALARLAYKYQVSRLLGAIEDWLMAPEVVSKTPTQVRTGPRQPAASNLQLGLACLHQQQARTCMHAERGGRGGLGK